jgi:peptide deformylase
MLKKKELLIIGVCGTIITCGVYFILHFSQKNRGLPILVHPNPALRQVTHQVNNVDYSVISLSKSMIATLQSLAVTDFFFHGSLPRGLAATQVGVPKRLFVCGINGKIKVLINPKIIERMGTYISHEGCLSLPGQKEKSLKRSAYVKLKYKDLKNRERTLVARNRYAALVEHEIDHLNGIMNIDY